MSDAPDDHAYRRARIAAAAAIVGAIGLALVIDAFRSDFMLDPLVLIPMLTFAAGALGVKLPDLRR